MLAGLVALQMLAPSEVRAGNNPCPAGGIKIDGTSLTCPEGEVITGICVKAGRDGFGVGDGETSEGAGCYNFSGLGDSAGSVSGGGTGRNCKSVSNSTFYCSEGGDPPGFCGDGVVDAGEQCDPPGPFNDDLFCNEACQFVEDPPEDPVCGNGVTEAGEGCDPPGPINEDLFCGEDCQIVDDPGGIF
jgi:hypothetical protein